MQAPIPRIPTLLSGSRMVRSTSVQGASVISLNESGDAASVVMTGGEVRTGISVSLGNLAVSGGQVRGFDNPMYGADAVFVSSSAQITGGTFTGGNCRPSRRAALSSPRPGRRTASRRSRHSPSVAGPFIGGTGSGGYYGGTTGYSLLSLGNTTVTGGHFLSPIAINGAYGGVTDFVGTHLTYNNNILSGFLENGDPIHVQVYASAVSATGERFRNGSSLLFGFVEQPLESVERSQPQSDPGARDPDDLRPHVVPRARPPEASGVPRQSQVLSPDERRKTP